MIPTVLVVDDSLIARTAVAITLELAGFAIIQARDGVEALAVLSQPSPPALMVLDLNMPRMNGMELLEHLQASGLPRIPVLLLTSHPSAALDQAAAKALGIRCVIMKPFKPELLVMAARLLAAAAA